MGQNKTVACKRVKRKKHAICCMFFLIINLCFNIFSVNAHASSTILTFTQDVKKHTIGYMGEDTIYITLESIVGSVVNRSIIVKNKSGNLIILGYDNSVNLKADQYPLSVEFDGNTKDYYVRFKVSTEKDSKNDSDNSDNNNNNTGSSGKDYSNFLDKIIGLLEDIQTGVNKIVDYMVNTQQLQNSIDNLKNSIDNLNNKFMPNSSVSGGLGTLGSSSADFSGVEVDLGFTKINALDLSAMGGILQEIRVLMQAIIWVEFAMFCIKIVVPKFKV